MPFCRFCHALVHLCLCKALPCLLITSILGLVGKHIHKIVGILKAINCALLAQIRFCFVMKDTLYCLFLREVSVFR